MEEDHENIDARMGRSSFRPRALNAKKFIPKTRTGPKNHLIHHTNKPILRQTPHHPTPLSHTSHIPTPSHHPIPLSQNHSKSQHIPTSHPEHKGLPNLPHDTNKTKQPIHQIKQERTPIQHEPNKQEHVKDNHPIKQEITQQHKPNRETPQKETKQPIHPIKQERTLTPKQPKSNKQQKPQNQEEPLYGTSNTNQPQKTNNISSNNTTQTMNNQIVNNQTSNIQNMGSVYPNSQQQTQGSPQTVTMPNNILSTNELKRRQLVVIQTHPEWFSKSVYYKMIPQNQKIQILLDENPDWNVGQINQLTLSS